MTEIKFIEAPEVTLLECLASDVIVSRRARVSTGTIGDVVADKALVRRLLLDRHGSPFEHTLFTWEILAPQWIALESNRHRISSISAESGRYRELRPIFYRMPADRPMVKVQGSKQMEYRLEPGDAEQIHCARHETERVAALAWESYRHMLDIGIAREVARIVLPQNICVTWHLTMNARALMNYLSLRVRDERAQFESKPMLEIQAVALALEADFATAMPATYAAFNENGRIAP